MLMIQFSEITSTRDGRIDATERTGIRDQSALRCI
jgi:hypothetical protein